MSIRSSCDICGKEAGRFDRVKKKLGDVQIEIMVAHKNVWNAGHICEDCVFEAFAKGEDVESGYVDSL
jgi:hypothetical protein